LGNELLQFVLTAAATGTGTGDTRQLLTVAYALINKGLKLANGCAAAGAEYAIRVVKHA
jgi:hypothetical protein